MNIIGELDRCVGLRVTVRVLDDTGRTRDLVGVLIDRDSIEKRDGTIITFALAHVTHWRVIPKRIARAGTGGPLSIRVRELESAAAVTWPAEVTVSDGEWLLRASSGITRQANSALPLGRATATAEAALTRVIEFSRAQGIIPAVQVPLPTGEDLDQLLNSLGWTAHGDAYVLVQDTRALMPPDAALLIRYEDAPSDNWRSVQASDEAVGIMRRYPADYASVWLDGLAVGAGRIAVADDWGIISRVHVCAKHRRCGVGTAVVQALAGVIRDSGVDRLAVQIDADDAQGLGLYGSLGFRKHHMYRQRVLTEPSVKGAS